MSDPGHIAGFQAIPNCVQVRLVWTISGGKTIYNVMHGRVAGGFVPTGTIAENVFTAIKAAAGWTNWKVKVNTTAALAGFDIRDMRTPNNPIVPSTSAASAGTGAGVALPPGDAVCVTLRTAFAGRGFRGRVYLPGLDTGAIAAGGLLAAGNDALAKGFVDAVSTAMTGQGMTLTIGQEPRSGYVGKTGATIPARVGGTADVTTTQVRNLIIDHQRRRAGRS